MDEAIIDSLRRAVEAAPGDVPLRVHLGRMLLERGRRDEATTEAAAALGIDPHDVSARALMVDALAVDPGTSRTATPAAGATPPTFDWDAAEEQVSDTVEARFGVEEPDITLADVVGMEAVTARLQAAFLAPLEHPELRARYGKRLRGGLLMYGPPGCGKTFLARAVAGELGARFLSVGITDVLDPAPGSSERNLHDAFVRARLAAPCVLFLDEVDALGQRRSQSRSAPLRGIVHQLLSELDGTDASNDGVFVLAATNQPWALDPALRRPGRLDRTVLVLPPDRTARAAILRHELAGRPVEGIDLGALAARTPGFSGADLVDVCELAAERVLMDGVRSGDTRTIRMSDVLAAVAESRPSTAAWFESARNVVTFGEDDGTYEELRDHLRRTRRS